MHWPGWPGWAGLAGWALGDGLWALERLRDAYAATTPRHAYAGTQFFFRTPVLQTQS